MSAELRDRLLGQVAMLPGRIVLKRGAVHALLDAGECEDGHVLLDVTALAGLPGMKGAGAVLKAALPKASLVAGRHSGLVLRAAAYDLALVPACSDVTLSALKASDCGARQGGSAFHIPWTLAQKSTGQEADADYSWMSSVYGLEGVEGKEALDAFLALPFPTSRIATGGVLIPEKPDLSKAKVAGEGGAVAVTHGDIYTGEQIHLAERFWMAYTSGRITVGHMRQGGFDPGEDVRVLESIWNWGPSDMIIGQQSFVPGSWILSAWFPGDKAWEKVANGEHKSWSLGSWFNYEIEPVEQ